MLRQIRDELLSWVEWWTFAVFSYLECLIHAEDGITSLVSKGDSNKKKLGSELTAIRL